MRFNSMQPKEVVIDGVTFIVKVLTAIQQAEIMDRLSEMKTNADLVKAGHLAMKYSIVNIKGLKDENGDDVKPEFTNGVLSDSFIDAFDVASIRPIVQAILKAGNIGEDVKKN